MKFTKAGVAALCFLALSGPAQAQSQREIEFVTAFFGKLQPISIQAEREYCGYFGLNEDNEYIATKPTRGDEGSCLSDDPPWNMKIIASYHTHGAFSYDYDSELPSSDDLQADIGEETNGYISTPGGRIWFNDSKEERAILICGRNCTVSDPEYEADGGLPVRNSYTLQQLRDRESNQF